MGERWAIASASSIGMNTGAMLAAWLTAATVSVMVRPVTVPTASTASTRFVRSASSTSFAPSVTMTTLSRGIS